MNKESSRSHTIFSLHIDGELRADAGDSYVLMCWLMQSNSRKGSQGGRSYT